MKPTLLILAAGMASRYGSLKQIDAFGPNGETIIDYSIYDAIRSGFGKVIFIIREEFSESFRAVFDDKLRGKIEVDYVYQTFDLVPFGINEEIERAKPWGTAHAILAAKDTIKEPFCVINADDFYGLDSYQKMAHFLTSEVSDSCYSLMGYVVDKTLSEHGSVSRGICKVDENGFLSNITERTKVYRKDGEVVYEENESTTPLPNDAKASMNFWGFTPKVFDTAKTMFKEFALAHKNEPKAEFFIPLLADQLTQSNQVVFKVIPTDSQWFGVTYKEDKPIVQESINQLIQEGVYPEKLWN